MTAIRVTRIEIANFASMSEERKEAWKRLAVEVQHIKNRLWKLWEVSHVLADSERKLREHFAEMDSIIRRDVGTRPVKPRKPKRNAPESAHENFAKQMADYQRQLGDWEKAKAEVKAANKKPFPVQCFNDDWISEAELAAYYPRVHGRVVHVIYQKWIATLLSRKASTGNLPGWVAILLDNENKPSFKKPQPIPFDNQTKKPKLIKDGKTYWCEIRLDRLEDKSSVLERCELMLNKRKAGSVRAIVDRCISGEYSFRGGELLFEDGKWFLMLAYIKPQEVVEDLDPNKVMYVKPGRRFPWLFKIGHGKTSRYVAGNGDNILGMRRYLDRQRKERMSHHRYSSGSNRKGHGRLHATEIWTKLSDGWRNTCKNSNEVTTRKLVEIAAREKCGTIVYLQPNDERKKARRFLTFAGSNPRCSMTWDYFQFGSILKNKCHSKGIKCVVETRKTKDRSAARGMRDLQQIG